MNYTVQVMGLRSDNMSFSSPVAGDCFWDKYGEYNQGKIIEWDGSQYTVLNVNPANDEWFLVGSPVTSSGAGSVQNKPYQLCQYNPTGIFDNFIIPTIGDTIDIQHGLGSPKSLTWNGTTWGLPTKLISVGGSTLTRNTNYSAALDTSVLTGIPAVSADDFFNSISNCEKVLLIYNPPSEKGSKIVSFINNGSDSFVNVDVKFHSKAKTGLWTLSAISLIGWSGENIIIKGASIPSGLNLTIV